MATPPKTTPRPHQTLDQQRAHFADAKVSAVREFSEFHTQIKRLPSRIRISGLGQAYAFLDAKGHREVTSILDEWIQTSPVTRDKTAGKTTLRQMIEDNDSEFYRLATDEALAVVYWLMRFADCRKKG